MDIYIKDTKQIKSLYFISLRGTDETSEFVENSTDFSFNDDVKMLECDSSTFHVWTLYEDSYNEIINRIKYLTETYAYGEEYVIDSLIRTHMINNIDKLSSIDVGLDELEAWLD